MPYDIHMEALGCTNELYYRDGAIPKDIRCDDVGYVTETIERCLREAFEAGVASVSNGNRA